MELIDAIRRRVSAREFSDRPIPGGVIDEMLDAARLAPTPGNAQGNIIGAVRDAALKNELARAAGNQMWIASAPVVFALCGDISWDIRDQPEGDFGVEVNHLRFGKEFIEYTNRCPDRRAMNKLFANGGPCLAGEHMFLVAVSHGLSACFVGYLDTERASSILRLPESLSCLFLLPVGYSSERAEPPVRKSVGEMCFYDMYGGERWR